MHQSEVPIPSPCAADWNAMTGDARKRYCATCAKHVHDLSAMTERQARATAVPGSCVRYAHDRFGRIRHLPTFAIGTLLAGPAFASGMPADEVPSDGIVSRVARAVSGWWRGEPVVIEPLVMVAGGIRAPPTVRVVLAPSVALPVDLELVCADGPRTQTLEVAESWLMLPYDGVCTARFAGDTTAFPMSPYTTVGCDAARGERCVVQ